MNRIGLEQAVEIVGPEYASKISGAGESRADASAEVWEPTFVRPGSIDEVSRLVRLAYDQDASVVPIGAGTEIRWARADAPNHLDDRTHLADALRRLLTAGQPVPGSSFSPRPLPAPTSPGQSFPQRRLPELLLSIERLNSPIEHSPADMVARIPCGISFLPAQATLATGGQHIPLDPAVGATATVGGTLAMNRSGPRRLRYGTARDWVIGTTLVRPDGTVVRAGGMVVKNVSGYDLNKLYLGSRGSLGILVEANFKLAPIPAARAELRARSATDADDPAGNGSAAWEAFRAFWDGGWPVASAVWSRPWDGEAVGTLSIVCEGSPEALGARRDQALIIASRSRLHEIEWIPFSDRGRADSSGHRKPSRFLGWADSESHFVPELVVRAHYSPNAHQTMVTNLRTEARHLWPSREISHFGCGVTWFFWERAPGTEDVESLLGSLRAAVAFVVVERYVRDLTVVAGPAGGAEDLERRLTNALNPKGTLRAGIPWSPSAKVGP